MQANPQAAKSQRIMEVLNDRINPLPQYMIDEINQGIFSVSSKEELESKLAYYKQERKLTLRKLLRMYLSK